MMIPTRFLRTSVAALILLYGGKKLFHFLKDKGIIDNIENTGIFGKNSELFKFIKGFISDSASMSCISQKMKRENDGYEIIQNSVGF